MKKVILLASLALIGVACSKSDDSSNNDNGGGGNNKGGDAAQVVNPSNAPAVYPTERQGGAQNYNTTTYTLENNKVKTVVKEYYQGGIKNSTQTTQVTYTDGKKFPTKVKMEGTSYSSETEYTYNDNDQITEMKNTSSGSLPQVIKLEYDTNGRLSKIIKGENVTTFEYPNPTTVVEKNSANPNNVRTYTVVDGNVTKFLEESKNDQGQVEFSQVQEYEYNSDVKNPDFSLERRLLDPSYAINYYPYSADYSKNMYTKKTDSYVDHGNVGGSRSYTYTYDKNDKGYPTKRTQKDGEGIEDVTTYSY